MGKLLQVRVSAYTVDPGKVEEAWPILSHLAYPAGHDYAPAKRGVLELVDTLHARLTAGEIPGNVAKRLSEGIGKAVGLTEELCEALSSWQAEKAQRLTEVLEDALDDLEDRAGYK
ncbi:MAG: formin-like protein 18 [Thermodesulfobacteriota bacterium]